MMNQTAVDTKADSVDVKEYLAVLLKRKWLILVCFLLSMAGTTAFLFTRQPIFRSNLKMLVTTAGVAVPSSEVFKEDEARFYGTQIDIMKSQTMLKRVQQKLRKTADEIRENLVDLSITPVRGSSIILVSVDSPSRDFAREFSNTLAEEYMRFREEQRLASSESVLLSLTREVTRLNQEVKAADDKIVAYARDHNITDLSGQGYSWYKRYSLNAGALTVAIRNLANAKTRKEVLDARHDTAAAVAFLTSQTPLATSESETDENASSSAMPGVINPGEVISITVVEDPSLNAHLKVSDEGKIEYAPLGEFVAEGMTPEDLATQIKDGLKAGRLVKPREYMDQWGKFDADALQKEAGLDPTVNITIQAAETPTGKASSDTSGESTFNRDSFGALSEAQAAKLFEYERKRQELQVRLEEMRHTLKPMHPQFIATEKELKDTTSRVESEIRFLRQKADADLLVAQRRYDEIIAASRSLDAAAIAGTSRILELRVLKDDAERIRSQYNAMISQLIKLDTAQNFKARTISVLEQAVVDTEPIYPKKMKGLIVAAFFGLGLGLALAFFIEYIDDSIKLAEEVERDLQLPFLGMIPAAQWSPDDLAAHRLDRLKQQGGVAESYRVVRSAIIFSTPREKLRSILLTSAVPREGKTTTCVNLSIGFAQIEERVLLIDADLRRGEVHKYFGFEREKGLSDVLLGEMTPEQAIRRTNVPKLDVMTSGAYPANPAELLLGWRLKETLEWAYKNYDRVIIDCTPVMGIADSAILGSAVDGCLFVIWAGRTSRRYVRVAKMTAVSRGAKIFGFVLNNLEPGRVGYYHYYPYYYSYYSRGYYYARQDEKDDGKGGDIKGIEVPSPEGGEEQIDDVY